MYLRTEITLAPGGADALERCLLEYLVPAAEAAGWCLMLSLRQTDKPNQILNIWNVGDRLDAGLDAMRAHPDYTKYKALLAQCVVHETRTVFDQWRP